MKRLIRPLGASVIIHSAMVFALLISIDTQPVRTDELVQIEFIDKPLRPEARKSPATHRPGIGRVSNDQPYIGDNIGERIAAEDYIRRLRGFLDPGWQRAVYQRLRILDRRGLRVNCITCCEVQMDKRGNNLGTVLRTKCRQDDELDEIALEALDRNFPPPPSTLLINGLLMLDWCFHIKR